jgi:hypothetical protein
MPNTTNFNWPTPADTDLVKDGAAAIRNLGNGVDTSLVDLKGGTTGQILSKASNADMDFAFVTPNVGDLTEVQAGTGISVASGTGPIPIVTNTMATEITAKGDLIVGTGSGTFDNLPAGTNGFTLVADSVETTGLKWVAPASGSLTLLSTTTLSGASTTVSGISQDYTHLYCEIYEMTNNTANGNLVIEPNSTSSNYMAALRNAVAYYASDIRTDNNAISRTDSGNSFGLFLYNYTSSHFKSFHFWGFAFGDIAVNGAGSTTSNTAISSIKVSNSGGNFSAGTIKIYGVK